MNKNVKRKMREMIVQINRQETARCEQKKINDELIGLYRDIIEKTLKYNSSDLIFHFSKLLQQQLSLTDPEQAYQFAYLSPKKSVSEIEKDYLFMVLSSPIGLDLQKEIQGTFNKLEDLLGEERGLISDFTDCYRNVFGGISRNIGLFIQWGVSSQKSKI